MNIRKSAKEFISILVDCGACFSRPHNIFGRVRSVEVKPPVVDGTPALLRSRVGSFPEARPVLGEVTETLCAAGTEDLGGPDVGAFPGRAIPRARVPFRPDDHVYIGFMYYICGLSANSQEMFSTCDCV